MVKFSSRLGFCVGGNGTILATEFFVIKRLPWKFETREPILELDFTFRYFKLNCLDGLASTRQILCC